MLRRPRAASTGVCLALGLAIMVTACTGDGSEPEVDGPGAVDAALTDEDQPRLTVTFEPVSGADAYVLQLDGLDQPIRLPADGCSDDECQITLDRLTTAGATSATVSAVQGDQTSEPSDQVELPAWPAPEARPTELSPDEPVEIAVTRLGPDGRPTVSTETLPRAGDVKQRLAALEAQRDVLSAEVAVPLAPLDDGAETRDNPFPAGIATWQQEALDFDSLPADPRGEGVIVAVLDDGLYAEHPNLDQADITEVNTVQPGRDGPGDHATSVASMIVGEHTGLVPGIAVGTTIRAYDIYNEDGDPEGGLADDLARAIYQAVDDGADVINISQAATCLEIATVDVFCPRDTLGPAVDHAEEQGVIVVAAAGNDGDGADYCAGTNRDTWPAAFPSVIAVGGTARDGSVWPCSPDKDYVDVLAPAANIQVAASPDGYEIASGTSLATPLVAGLFAAILAELPDLTPADIRDALAYSVDENGRLLAGLLLQALGLEPAGEPVVDLSTGVEFWPFSAGFYFPEGSTVSDQVAAATVPDRDYEGGGDQLDAHYLWSGSQRSFDWFFDDTFPVLIGGLLAVDEDGAITGFGKTQFDQHRYPFHVECPEIPAKPGGPRPRLAYTWDVPVLVSGQVSEDEQTGNRYAELTLSLGEDATPEEAGRLPDIAIVDDDFDDCAADIKAADTLFSDPIYPWSEVKTWPERHVALHQRVHERVIGASPFHIAEGFFPPAEPDESQGEGAHYYESGGEDGDVGYRLQIGGIDFYQLDPT